MDNVNLKRKITLKRKGDAHDQEAPEGKKPIKFIWLAVIGLVVIGGVFGLKQLNQESHVEGGTEEFVVTEDINTNPYNDEPELVTTNKEETNSTVDQTTSDQNEVANTAETKSTTSVDSAVTGNPNSTGVASSPKEDASKKEPSNRASQSSAAAIQGSVEEKARQVISGAFGNGADRKNALGAEYAEIQAKVNEMYRNGMN
jgi:preprotein translocase subunit SecF